MTFNSIPLDEATVDERTGLIGYGETLKDDGEQEAALEEESLYEDSDYWYEQSIANN